MKKRFLLVVATVGAIFAAPAMAKEDVYMTDAMMDSQAVYSSEDLAYKAAYRRGGPGYRGSSRAYRNHGRSYRGPGRAYRGPGRSYRGPGRAYRGPVRSHRGAPHRGGPRYRR